jgi:hypothetical protein
MLYDHAPCKTAGSYVIWLLLIIMLIIKKNITECILFSLWNVWIDCLSDKSFRNCKVNKYFLIAKTLLCRLYGVVATYRDHLSAVCPSVRLSARPSQNLAGLFLMNLWCNFIKSFNEWSVPYIVVHIVSIVRFNNFWPSNGPLFIFIFKGFPNYFSYKLTSFKWNFTGLIFSSSPCAYCTGFPFEYFWPSYGPSIKRCFCVCKIHKSLSGLLLKNYNFNFNFIQALQDWSVSSKSCCEYHRPFMVQWVLSE